jgi:hypothetical protein
MRQGREPCDAVYDGQSRPTLATHTSKMHLLRDDRPSRSQWLGVRRPNVGLGITRNVARIAWSCTGFIWLRSDVSGKLSR